MPKDDPIFAEVPPALMELAVAFQSLASVAAESRSTNVKGGSAVAARIGAVERYWLPGPAKAMAHRMQMGTYPEAEQSGLRTGRLPYSRSSFERNGHAVAQVYVEEQAEIKDRLRDEMVIPVGAVSISVSVDSASLPPEEPRSRLAGRPAKNAPKNPISRVYRMA